MVAVGANNPDWDLAVLKQAGNLIDYLSIHQYWGNDDCYGTVAAAAAVERRLRLLCSVLDVAEAGLQRETPLEIAFDEWNVWYRGRQRPWEEFYALKDALVAAGVDRHRSQPATLRLDPGPVRPRQPGGADGGVEVYELTGPDPMQQNTVERPDAITPTHRRLAALPDTLELAPCSLTVLERLTTSG